MGVDETKAETEGIVPTAFRKRIEESYSGRTFSMLVLWTFCLTKVRSQFLGQFVVSGQLF